MRTLSGTWLPKLGIQSIQLSEGTMKHKVTKRSKKRNKKRRKIKTYSKKGANGVAINLQKVVDFKFETLGKIYKNFSKKRAIEKEKKE